MECNILQKIDVLLRAVSEGILRLYCEEVGIDFQDSMVNWNPLTEEQHCQFRQWVPWMSVVTESSTILKKSPTNLPEIADLSEWA